MQRVTRSTAAAVLPAAPASPGTPGYFAGGDPVSNVPATVPGYEWFNGVQEELIGVILRAGLAPDQADLAQLRKSLDRLFGGGLRTVSANLSLAADDAGVVLVDAAAASRTITLPAVNAANGRPLRFTFIRVDTAGANGVTIERAGADTIEAAVSITVPVSGRVMLVSDGVSNWRVFRAESAVQGGTQIFTSSDTFVVPPGVTRVWVEVAGGGGRGGTSTGGGGGGSGGRACGWVNVTPGNEVPVTVGAGSTTGAAGGTSSFGSFMSATGGTSAGMAFQGAFGGIGVGGALNLRGGSGTSGLGSVSAAFEGGCGGSNGLGGGGVGGGGAAHGANGGVGGGGGGGAGGSGTLPGNGGAGVVIVMWR